MSAIGQILGTVDARVRELVSSLKAHNKAQDARLDALEKRVADLEERLQPPTSKPTAAKAAPAKTASAARTTK